MNQEVKRHLRLSIQEKAARGDYKEAIALSNQLLANNPNSARDYNNRGLIYFRSGDQQNAMVDYNQALALDPRLDGAYNNRGNCYAKFGYLAEALGDYDRAIDYNPGNIRAWINQGITFRELGLYDLAIENFDLTLTLTKKLKGRIYFERGRSFHLRGDWNLAISDYKKALKILSGCEGERVLFWLEQLLLLHIA
jgi:tetratricopeptide (TPR) repeat protein